MVADVTHGDARRGELASDGSINRALIYRIRRVSALTRSMAWKGGMIYQNQNLELYVRWGEKCGGLNLLRAESRRIAKRSRFEQFTWRNDHILEVPRYICKCRLIKSGLSTHLQQ